MITSIVLHELNRPALEGVLSHLWAADNWPVLREACIEPGIQHVFCRMMENTMVHFVSLKNAKPIKACPEAYANINENSWENFRIEVLDKLSAKDREAFLGKWWESISTAGFDVFKHTGFPNDFLDDGWLPLPVIDGLSAAKGKAARLWLSWRDSQEVKKWPKTKVVERWEQWFPYYDVHARGAMAKWFARAPIPSEERELWLTKICDAPGASRNEMKKWWETEMPALVAHGAGLKPEEVPLFPSISREFVFNLIHHTLTSNPNKTSKVLPWIDAMGDGTLAHHQHMENRTTAEQIYWTLAQKGEAVILNALMTKGYKPRKDLIRPGDFQTKNSVNKYDSHTKMPWLAALAWVNFSLDENVAKVFIKAYPEMMKDALTFCAERLAYQSKTLSQKNSVENVECCRKVQKVLLGINLGFVAENERTVTALPRVKI